MKKGRSEFLVGLVDFYQTFFSGMSASTKKLSALQRKYPEQYNEILEFDKDSSAINDLLDNLDTDQQAILLRLLLKASTVGRRMSTLLHLNADEQKELAKDLEAFSKEYTKNLTMLQEERDKMKKKRK